MDSKLTEISGLIGTDVLTTYYYLMRASRPVRVHELAKYSGLSKATVSRNLQRLVAKGWAERDGYRFRAVKDVLYKVYRDEQAVLVRDAVVDGGKTAELLESVLKDLEQGRVDLPRSLLVRIHAALERVLSEG